MTAPILRVRTLSLEVASTLPSSRNRSFRTVSGCFVPNEDLTASIPVKACYGERYPELIDATYLWNERSMRGIPAIAAAEGVGSVESMHMQMDVRSYMLQLLILLLLMTVSLLDCINVRSLGHY